MKYANILLIDDDEDDRQIFSLAVNAILQDISIANFWNAQLALKQLESKELTPDIIFLDLNMPGMNGQQFLSIVKKKEETKQIPVVILSTTDMPQIVAETIRLGAAAFITKPTEFSKYKEKLRAIFD